jgi:small subunit ribosomal protein S11
MTEEVQKTEEAVAPVAEETTKKKKSSRRQILRGRATIQCTYNNTIISLTDINGNVLGWSSSGHMGFKGAKKSTP